MTDCAAPRHDGQDEPTPADWDEDEDCASCSWCGGEWYMQECDDPIQCCSPRCDGQWHPCDACQGTGLAKHQVIW